MRLDSIEIMSVWQALGGGELRGRRAKAFWRDGDGYNISIDVAKNSWHDFVTDAGGYSLSLVMTAMSCEKRAALAWLQDNVGLDRASSLGKAMIARDDWRAARRWGRTAELLSDTLLDVIDTDDPARLAVIRIRRIARAGGLDLMTELLAWKQAYPELAAAMIHTGLACERRLHTGLASLIKEMAECTV